MGKIVSTRGRKSNLTAEQLFLIQEIAMQFNALCAEAQDVIDIVNKPHIQTVNVAQMNGSLSLRTVVANNAETMAARQLAARINEIAPILAAISQT